MKKFSKFLSVALALVLCMGMVSPAFAALPHTHRYGSWGYDTHRCVICGRVESHNMRYTNNVGSGGSSDNLHTMKCSDCGVIHTESHDFGRANCLGIQRCPCGVSRKTTPNYSNHAGKLTYSYDDTQHWQTCSACGEDTAKTDHVWNYTRNGSTVTAKCVCGAEYTLDHACTPGEDWKFDASGHWHECTVAGCPIPVMDKTAHTWDEGKVTTEPTCTEKGVKTYTCMECGYERTEEVKANGHSWDEGVVTTEPTCTENGVRTYTCTVCDATRTEPIWSLGHDYDSVYTWDDSQRAFVWSCSRCGAMDADCNVYLSDLDQDIRDALESGEVTNANYRIDVITPNTCVSEGSGTCVMTVVSVDGEVYEERLPLILPIDPDAHAPGAPVTENLDESTGAHESVVYCMRCGTELSRIQVGGGTEIDEPDVPLAGLMTRAEFVNYLYVRADSPAAGLPTFDDVAEDHEYAAAIGWAQANSIVKGVGNNEFAPDDLVTVEQARLILERYANFQGIEMPELNALTGKGSDEILDNADEVLTEFFDEDTPA